MTNQEKTKKPRGCFFYGCIVSLVFLILLGTAVFLGFRLAFKRINSTIAEYTDSKPMPLPKSEVSAADRESLKKRIAEFNTAVTSQSNTPPLILTGPDINVLLANSPEMKDLRDKFYITVSNNQVRGELSLPLENIFRIPYVDTKGRYLNGSGLFRVFKTNDDLFIGLSSVDVKGNPLPSQYMQQLQQVNFAESLNENPTNRLYMKEYERVEVTNGTVVIYPKQH
ncbi:hypothetical protein [Pedosphaera parvula]|uniref:Uncharacterized protein n=1 Tax=Pedosphaera parvula (strain Ellin514) TaxID=320771 RepID=B9XG81_PEDPL|nr:hypothetical protein [Pedosphaera parvula]EEF61243.1 hypothetical protein Cflav_PD3960 [Pedosphaera parvula Ellin514]